MNDKDSSLRHLFSEAVETTDLAARAAFLDEACRDQPALRARLETLLAAEAQAGHFLGGNAPSAGRNNFSEEIGSRIGRYQLRERIGQGGYGTVYLAEQQEPVRRLVALKIIKLGMDTATVVARFEAERQALAVMDHPNIARVFDAGATDTGRPFFVMEFVRGLPITDYCEQKNLGLAARLELFAQVCHGVQHAHQKGIIHRDLKPSNILVTELDGVPMPKVIDFGIAKATDAAADAPLTRAQDALGTPAYMSPEQVRSGPRDLDTRSDIYSLGVVLYELVAGATPFDGRALARAGLEEMRRLILETDPPRPSTRLMPQGNSAANPGPAAASRPRRMQEVRGDVDWIVMKCLEKDRARRYETASALAADIRRHLDHEPITARPPTTLYRLQKTIRRHRVGFAAATAVVLILMVAVVVSGWMAVQARRAEQLAKARAASEQRAREIAEANAIFIQSVFGMDGTAPGRDPRGVTVAERLARAALLLRDPRYQVAQPQEMAYAIGRTCLSAGLYREAVPLLKEYGDFSATNAGPNARGTLKAMDLLALALQLDGRKEEARALFADVLRRRRATFGTHDGVTIKCMMNLAKVNMELERWSEAVALLEEASRLTTDPVDARQIQRDLAESYPAVGRHEDAVRLWREMLASAQRANGPAHADTAKARASLAAACLAAGQLDEAARLWVEASVHNASDRIYDIQLAALLVWCGKTEEHNAMTTRLLAATADTTKAGEANCVAKLACLRPLPDAPARQAARELARRAVQLGQQDSLLPWYQLSLGMAEYRQGDFPAADTALLAAGTGAEKISRRQRPFIQGTVQFFRVMSLLQQQRRAEAEQTFHEAVAAMKPAPDTARLLAGGASQDDLVLWLAWKEAEAALKAARP